MHELFNVVIGSVLFAESVNDIRNMKISVNRLWIYLGLAMIYLIVGGPHKSLIDLLAGIVIGLVFLFVGRVSEQAIGYGDGIVILILGICLGGKVLSAVISFALLSVMVVALTFVVLNKFQMNKVRKMKMAFIPFLFIGYIGGVLVCM